MNYYIILDDTYIFKNMLDVCNWGANNYNVFDREQHDMYEVALLDSELYDYYTNDTYKIMFTFSYDNEEYEYIEKVDKWWE